MACEPSCGTRRRDILRLATVPPTRGQQQIGGSRTHKFRMQFPQCKNQRTPKNRRISTIRLQDLKYCPGNCMRNCEAPHAWRAPEGPEGPDAVPVGGGRAWATHRQQATRLEAAAGPAGPGRASRRRADQRPGPTGVEGAGGTGGHGRASRRRAERSSRRGRRAGGQASRRPEIWRRHKHHRTEKPQNSS